MLPEKIEPNEILATFDVEGLYTNIDHNLGLEAISYWINNYENENPRINKDFILKSIDLILKNNNFIFNQENFIQIKGTAMGTRFAPTYATLVERFIG